MNKTFLIALVPVALSAIGCSANPEKETKDYFASWNECSSLTALKDFVKEATDKNSNRYIPVEDRIATFDMDGTFIGELYASYFEYNMLEYRVLEDPTYKDKAPADVKEVAQEIRDFVRSNKKTSLPDRFDLRHAHAAGKAYAGMSVAEFDKYVKDYAKKTPYGFTGMTYATSFYKPMLEVFDFLKDNDFTYYVVSGSDRFICRALTESLGIPSNRVIGMDYVLKSNTQGYEEGVNYTYKVSDTLIRTDELIIKNLKTNKVKQIAQEIGKVPVLSFGNSGGDSAMHNYALSNKTYKGEAFMLIADDEARDHANREKALALGEQWKEANYHVISMRDDFKTIYGEGVAKTDFNFETSPVSEVTFDAFHDAAVNVTDKNYEAADLRYLKEVVEYDSEGKPTTFSSEEVYKADFDQGKGVWTFDDEKGEDYVHFVTDLASTLNQEGPLFDNEAYQTLSTYYYTGDGFRFRYKGSGSQQIDNVEQNNAVEGVTVYDEFGHITYDECVATTSNSGNKNKTVVTTKAFISYR